VIVIYDSFVNQIEEELFLCDTNMDKNKWIRRDHIRPLKTLFDCIETRVSDKACTVKVNKIAKIFQILFMDRMKNMLYTFAYCKHFF